jgi:hypothetical protein
MNMWKNLTKAQQRVAIAKDVIKQIHGGTLTVATGRYCEGHYSYLNKFFKDNTCITRHNVVEIRGNCLCCALGSMLLSRVFLGNKVPRHAWSDGIGWEECRDGLRCFTGDHLIEIECAFERGHPLYRKIPDPTDRLLAIMQNIVDHNGTFKPDVEYEVV